MSNFWLTRMVPLWYGRVQRVSGAGGRDQADGNEDRQRDGDPGYRDIFATTVIRTLAVFFVIGVFYTTGLL